ncbi:MAG: histidine triad nucleotide-binding protein [Clostridia bacterium]
MNKDCIFCKIIAGEIPSKKVFENEDMIIINDISPQAKCHYLMIPKKHYENIGDLATNDPELLGRCFAKFATLTDTLGLGNGYRIITNKGYDGCQSVNHIHIHILGGEHLSEKMG